jgi:hypothetical protein
MTKDEIIINLKETQVWLYEAQQRKFVSITDKATAVEGAYREREEAVNDAHQFMQDHPEEAREILTTLTETAFPLHDPQKIAEKQNPYKKTNALLLIFIILLAIFNTISIIEIIAFAH